MILVCCSCLLCVAFCLSVSEMHTTTATRLLPLLPSLLKIMVIIIITYLLLLVIIIVAVLLLIVIIMIIVIFITKTFYSNALAYVTRRLIG